jgi:hypothetical protein
MDKPTDWLEDEMNGSTELAQQTRCSEPGDGALVDNRGSVAPGR